MVLCIGIGGGCGGGGGGVFIGNVIITIIPVIGGGIIISGGNMTMAMMGMVMDNIIIMCLDQTIISIVNTNYW